MKSLNSLETSDLYDLLVFTRETTNQANNLQTLYHLSVLLFTIVCVTLITFLFKNFDVSFSSKNDNKNDKKLDCVGGDCVYEYNTSTSAQHPNPQNGNSKDKIVDKIALPDTNPPNVVISKPNEVDDEDGSKQSGK